MSPAEIGGKRSGVVFTMMGVLMRMGFRSAFAVVLLAGSAAAGGAAPQPSSAAELLAVKTDDLDVENCLLYADGKEAGRPTAEQVGAVLGLAPFDDRKPWSSGETPARRRDFRVAFKRAVSISAVVSPWHAGPEKRPLQPLYGCFISALKSDAAYPGDPAREDSWTVLPAGSLKCLDAPIATRALRFTGISADQDADSHWNVNARLKPVLLLKERCYDPLTGGSQTQFGNAKEGRPEYWIQSWAEPRNVGALAVWYSGDADVSVWALDAAVDRAPPLAAETNWLQAAGARVRPGAQLIAVRAPGAVRALKVNGPDASRMEHGGAIVPLCFLKAGEPMPAREGMPPPYAVSYDMPLDGFSAVQIYDKGSGKLVRRLYAEIAKEKGPVSDGWDLRDDAGNYVAPGAYLWKALVRPPFKLTYELTVNNAGQPPWWAPAPGKGGGGWLGDHGTPNCAAANGDRMWFGTMCTENGHAAIATDLEGNKLWGTHHVGYGFRGPMYIACDDQAAYLMLHELIVRVIPSRDFEMRQVFTCPPSPDYPWLPVGYEVTRGGAAARDGKVYWAINAPPEEWFKSSFASDTIEPKKCIPGVGLFKGKGNRKDKDKNYEESEYDELMKLYAALLTGRTPDKTATIPDTPIPSSTQAYFGDAAKSGDFAGSVVVVFKEPVGVGSVLVPDAGIKVYALRPELDPDAVLQAKSESSLDESPRDEGLAASLSDAVEDMDEGKTMDELWIRLRCDQQPGEPGIAAAPKGALKTRALRYKVRRLIFSQVVSRRFENCAPQAKRVLDEGKTTTAGGWTVERKGDRILSPAAPAYAALVWDAPTALRGLSLSYPVFGEIRVDLWKGGAADPAKSLKDNTAWEETATLAPDPVFKGYFPQTPTCRHVDFGRVVTNRAVRIRVLAGSDNVAGFQGMVAWKPLGEDAADLPLYMNERIAVIEMPPLNDGQAEAKVVANLPVPKPGGVAFDPNGELLCVSDGRIVKPALDGKGEPKVLVDRGFLEKPVGLAIDAQGLCYVSDQATCDIKVLDPKTGKLVRTIGAGRQKSGPWDPARLDAPTQVAVDKRGRVWVADASYQPKRIQRFAADGKPDQSFLGPAQYGGGGWLDPKDKSKLYYNGMRFAIDWTKRDWKLDSLIYRLDELSAVSGATYPERLVYFKGRRYLVGPCRSGDGVGRRDSIALVCEERGPVAVPMAAAGKLESWDDVDRRPDLLAKYGAVDRSRLMFSWSDSNGDGQPQADEVKTAPIPKAGGIRGGWFVGEDLALLTPGYRLRPDSILPNGVPVYDIGKMETFTTFTHGPGARTENLWGTEDGRIFMIGTRLIAPDGQAQLWEYYNEFACHEGYYQSRFGYDRPPGVLNQEHKPIGHFRVGDEEYFVTNTDQGDFFCFTADGFFVGCIFGGPTGYGLRRWTMPEWEPGKVDLSDVRLPQEHYQGCVVAADDGKVYAVAGHNFVGITRVDGFEQVKRLQGPLAVKADDLAKTRDWELSRSVQARGKQERKGMKVPLLKRKLEISGSLTAWPQDVFVTIHERWMGSLTWGKTLAEYARGALAYNSDYLYVAAKVSDESPMQNAATEPTHVFKGGDAVDVTLGFDPKADPARRSPAPGDFRLILSFVKGKPVAVLYRPIAPDAPAGARATFQSPVGTTSIEEVRVVPEAQVAYKTERGLQNETYWTLTAAIPWKSLGVSPPEPDVVVRGDIGVLRSDPNGVQTASRVYWSGKTQTVVCDVPSETRLIPALWGELIFEGDNVLSDDSILKGKDTDSFIPETPEMDL